MKAAWYEKIGAANEVLQIGELEDPIPQAGEVLVEIKASGVNPSDVKTRAGARGELQFPKIIPHSDGGGVITAEAKVLMKIELERVFGFGMQHLEERMGHVLR